LAPVWLTYNPFSHVRILMIHEARRSQLAVLHIEVMLLVTTHAASIEAGWIEFRYNGTRAASCRVQYRM